jgi:cell division protein FtsQ
LKKPERELLVREKKRLTQQSQKDKPKKISKGGFTIWGRIIAVAGPLMLVALVAATLFTPLLAIESVSVTGTSRLSQDKIEKSLKSLIGRPLTTVSDSDVTELLSEFGLIETFALQAEPPHTLTVKIRERQPLLILVNGANSFLFDAAGVKIAPPEKTDSLPFMNLNTNPQEDSRFKTAVEVLLSLPVKNYEKVFSIEVSKQLTTTLVLKDSEIRVIWGGVDEPLLKAEVLDSLINTGLDKGVSVDVSSPNSPVVTHPNY